jgi:serine/threonine protein kinase
MSIRGVFSREGYPTDADDTTSGESSGPSSDNSPAVVKQKALLILTRFGNRLNVSEEELIEILESIEKLPPAGPPFLFRPHDYPFLKRSIYYDRDQFYILFNKNTDINVSGAMKKVVFAVRVSRVSDEMGLFVRKTSKQKSQIDFDEMFKDYDLTDEDRAKFEDQFYLDYREKFDKEVTLTRQVSLVPPQIGLVDIVAIGDYVSHKSGDQKTFVLERCYSLGDLFEIEADTLSLANRLRIAEDLIIGLSRLHRAGIYHRDLKHMNVVIHTDYHAAITDLGLACKRDDKVELTRRCGSRNCLAPEVEEGAEGFTFTAASDIWALGNILEPLSFGDDAFRAIIQAMMSDLPEQRIPLERALEEIRFIAFK